MAYLGVMIAGLLRGTVVACEIVERRLREPLVDESHGVDVTAGGGAETESQVFADALGKRGRRLGIGILIGSPYTPFTVLLCQSC